MFRRHFDLPSKSDGSGPQRSNVNCLRVSPFAATHTRIQPLRKNTSPVNPFLATLVDTTQLHENKTTLSLVFSTLTRLVTHNSFVCRSYEKHPGVGCLFQARRLSPSSSVPQGAKPLAHPRDTARRTRITASLTFQLSTFNFRLFKYNPRTLFRGTDER
jgi:hypothetical protein